MSIWAVILSIQAVNMLLHCEFSSETCLANLLWTQVAGGVIHYAMALQVAKSKAKLHLTRLTSCSKNCSVTAIKFHLIYSEVKMAWQAHIKKTPTSLICLGFMVLTACLNPGLWYALYVLYHIIEFLFKMFVFLK